MGPGKTSLRPKKSMVATRSMVEGQQVAPQLEIVQLQRV